MKTNKKTKPQIRCWKHVNLSKDYEEVVWPNKPWSFFSLFIFFLKCYQVSLPKAEQKWWVQQRIFIHNILLIFYLQVIAWKTVLIIFLQTIKPKYCQLVPFCHMSNMDYFTAAGSFHFFCKVQLSCCPKTSFAQRSWSRRFFSSKILSPQLITTYFFLLDSTLLIPTAQSLLCMCKRKFKNAKNSWNLCQGRELLSWGGTVGLNIDCCCGRRELLICDTP